ncbi:MAG TPA: response regulator, partial [Planctomycetota bacterium]|nr:response regulator [Planctomycetota bacterium]
MPKRLLVVDDHEDTLLLMRDLLEGEGYQVRTASTAAAAEAALRSDKPDLLLLDVMLPDDSGLNQARALAGDPQLGQVPILLVTAMTTTAQLEREAREIPSVRRILYKPCRPRTILE